MLLSEFIDRTGYQPTAEEYAAIEREYYHFKGDKDAYCRAWCKANPSKAGTLWAKQKENERIGNVFDRLVQHIIKYASRKDFDRNMFYYMDYSQQQAHVDWVFEKVKARDRKELRDMIWKIGNSEGIMYQLSVPQRGYVWDLERYA